MLDIKNIVVPTDFSTLSQTAFEHAKDLAKLTDAVVHIVYVMDINPPFLPNRVENVTEEDMLKQLETDALNRLQICTHNLAEDSEINVTFTLRKGIDYEEIVNYAKEINSCIIVIATHGRTGAMHNLLGSVAEKVIRYAKCPVMVIKPEEE
jgi:universal stress protein A